MIISDRTTYKREFIRMMDSLRTEHKGEPNCKGVDCDTCPLKKPCDIDTTQDSFLAFDYIEIIERWTNEHPDLIKSDFEIKSVKIEEDGKIKYGFILQKKAERSDES